MDDELQQLEAELKRLRPLAPSPDLVGRVQRKIATPAARRTMPAVYWLWATIVPAAAALAVLFAPSAKLSAPGPGTAGVATANSDGIMLRPVAAENILVAAQDEGLVTLEDGTTARRARLKYVDTITWRNPRTNASLTWTLPREEVRVVPVVFQ